MDRKCSPLLRTKPLLRGTEKGEYFEGDLVSKDNTIYLITYESGGFVAKSGESTLTIKDLKDCPVVGTIVPQSVRLLNLPKGMQFKHGESVFIVHRLKGLIDRNLIVGCDGWKLIPPEEIKQNTFLRQGKDAVYFGDEIDGGIVVMQEGRICIQADTHCRELKLNGGA
jgi:hypothetical protein